MEDFEGKARGKNFGNTVSGIYFHTKESDGTLKLLVEAIFVKSKSFLRDSSEYVLRHERTHFNITEVNARRLRKRFAEKDFTKVKPGMNETQVKKIVGNPEIVEKFKTLKKGTKEHSYYCKCELLTYYAIYHFPNRLNRRNINQRITQIPPGTPNIHKIRGGAIRPFMSW